MTLALYLGFVAASIVLIAMPGPNVALIVANSVAHGTRMGFMTMLGTGAAMLVQLSFTVWGMSAVLGVLGGWFAWLRWCGVAYLVFLGLKAWLTPVQDLAAEAPPQPSPSLRKLVTRGFLVSLTNPKTLLFYGAFLPQFTVPAAGHLTAQLLLLAATFFAIAVALDSTWVILAGRLRPLLHRRRRLQARVTGTLLIGAGAGLALARSP